MAVYKNREVEVVHNMPGTEEGAMVTVIHKNGDKEAVKLREVALTKDELNQMKEASSNSYNGIKVISDKDLKSLRDSQDPAKIEKKNA